MLHYFAPEASDVSDLAPPWRAQLSHMLLTLFNKEKYDQYYAGGFWRDDTVYSLVKEHAARSPDRIAVPDGGRSCTYAQLLKSANSFGADLAERGVVAGQRIAVWLRVETRPKLALRNMRLKCSTIERCIGAVFLLTASTPAAVPGSD